MSYDFQIAYQKHQSLLNFCRLFQHYTIDILVECVSTCGNSSLIRELFLDAFNIKWLSHIQAFLERTKGEPQISHIIHGVTR